MSTGFLSRMPQRRSLPNPQAQRQPGQPMAPGNLRGQARQDFYAQQQPPMGGQMGIGAYEQNQIQRLPDYQAMQGRMGGAMNMANQALDSMGSAVGQMGGGQGDINQMANGMPTAQMGGGFGAQMGGQQNMMFNPIGKIGPLSPEQMQQMNQQRINQANPTQGQMGQMAPGNLRGPARQAFYQGQAAGQRR